MWVRLYQLNLYNYGYKNFTYNFRSIMTALTCVQLLWQFVTEQGQGGYRELRRLMPFVWVFVNYCVKYSITLYSTFIIDLIIKFVTLYIWNLSRVFIKLPRLVTFKISIITSTGAMECWLSVRCCANLDFPFPYLKSSKCPWNRT